MVREEKRNIVRRLLKERVFNVQVRGRHIKLLFDKKVLQNKVLIKHKYKYVAGWSKKNNEIFIDDDNLEYLKSSQIVSLFVHETVEKYVSQRYDLAEDEEAHLIAELVEYEWAKNNNVDWEIYDAVTDLIRKKDGRYI